MIDADVVVTTRSSAFDRLPARGRDLKPDDLDRLVASLDHLALCCCEPSAEKRGQHLPLEAMPEKEKILAGTVRTIGENL